MGPLRFAFSVGGTVIGLFLEVVFYSWWTVHDYSERKAKLRTMVFAIEKTGERSVFRYCPRIVCRLHHLSSQSVFLLKFACI